MCRLPEEAAGSRAKSAAYEELFHVPDRTVEQNLEMAEYALSLIEAGVFAKRQLERVRAIPKKAPSDAKVQTLWSECMHLKPAANRVFQPTAMLRLGAAKHGV
jgi:hypothetical protein